MRRTEFGVVAVVLLAAASISSAHADVPMSGTFVATTACPALQSIRKNTDPGNITLTPQQGYAIVSANNTPASHYMVIVPGAEPERRWVAINCGTLGGSPATTASPSIQIIPAPTPTPVTTAKPSR